MSSRFLDLGNISSNSLQNAAEAAWDSINVFDRVVLGSYVYQGVWMFMAYKYSGSQYGMMIVTSYNKNHPLYVLKIQENTKTVYRCAYQTS